MPLFPFVLGSKQGVSHIAQEFNLHYVDFLNRYAGNFSPSFVRVGIIIQDCLMLASIFEQLASIPTFIAQHQGNSQKPKFTPNLPFYPRIESF